MLKNKLFFSIVLPYFNEAEYIEKTLQCWLNQAYKPNQIILVNNGSTDNSEQLARKCLDGCRDIDILFLNESRPGKIFALESGLRAVTHPFVALSDADTFYPPSYLQKCSHLFLRRNNTVSAVMALDEPSDPIRIGSRLRRSYFLLLSKLFPKHNYAGGYGQAFRMSDLEKAGGFSEKLWPHVLMDHEIMCRLYQFGHSIYHVNHWCTPSSRRSDRTRVRWTLFERLLYQLMPHRFHRWFFHNFLNQRFSRRGLNHIKLREKPWNQN